MRARTAHIGTCSMQEKTSTEDTGKTPRNERKLEKQQRLSLVSQTHALPFVWTAREVNVGELNGQLPSSDDYLWRCCRCLHWVLGGLSGATGHNFGCSQAGMAENELLHNRQGLGLVHGPRGFVCIDNNRLIGKDRGKLIFSWRRSAASFAAGAF